MLTSTVTAIKAILEADPQVSIPDRKTILAMCRNGSVALLRNGKNSKPEAPSPPRILRRGEVAKRLGRSLRAVDRLCSEGTLKKIKLPGRQRAGGILESDVNALIASASAVNVLAAGHA